MRHLSGLVLFISILAAVYQPAEARKRAVIEPPTTAIAPPRGASDNPVLADQSRAGLNALDAPDTFVFLASNFNGGAGCSAQGWTSVDLASQTGEFWHIDDYAGLSFGPLQGSKSLWCGLRPGPANACTYLTLPGYGNNWDQVWSTKSCVSVAGGPTPNLDVSFTMHFDTETSYDAVALEYTPVCTGEVTYGIPIDGNIPGEVPIWSGEATLNIDSSYVVSGSLVKVRLHFQSDGAWSDEDGLWASDGAVHIDNLKVEDLALEDFEDESVGALSSNDWESSNVVVGNYAGLFKGSTLLQEDPCKTNLSCMWAFIQGSTDTYACGGHPEQIAVPRLRFGYGEDHYLSNEIWSPLLPVTGSGTEWNTEFDVYRDLPLDNLVFYTVKARAVVGACPTPWKSRNMVHEGANKDWYRHVEPLGAVLGLNNASQVQVALGVVDMCAVWCGAFGTAACHSHAPLFDNVKVYRVDTTGPVWNVRDVDLFQDTFATNGTLNGTARADMARDIRPSYGAPSIVPGDSAIVQGLIDSDYASGTSTGSSGLSNDPNLSTFIGRHKTKKQAYMYVAVWPLGQPGKSGAPLSEGPGGQANRYPYSGTVVAGGVTWTKIRMDYTYQGTVTNPGDGGTVPTTDPYVANRFNVDLNDNLFTPGDTICYFFSATSPGGTTYYSDQWHVTTSIDEVAANPMELTILPAGGFNRGGDMLYVDGADGLGVQPYYEGAFMVLGVEDLTDRYDVRGPSSTVGNRPASRVVNVVNQLNAAYENIVWDCGSLPFTLGDGTGDPDKTDDYALLNTFLGNLSTVGGVYLGGDDVPHALIEANGASAATFRTTYMPFTLVTDNHRAAPTLYGVSPTIKFWPGRAFTDDFFLFGGCPDLNRFDVMNATGTSRVEMSYNTASNPNGAVVSNKNGLATVVMAGFSLASVRDDELNGVSDRALYLQKAIRYSGSGPSGPVSDAGSIRSNTLAQNYPNPFNPTTTIAYSIKARGHVQLNVYDVGGRLVRALANETRPAGAYQITWDGRDAHGVNVASGVYFYRLVAGDFTQTKKMVLLK